MIIKQTSSEYIGNLDIDVSTYSNNPTAFYWNDGGKDIPILSIDDAVTDGMYISQSQFKFNINGLEGGNKYTLRLYVGVYKNNGEINATLTVGLDIKYSFIDNRVYNFMVIYIQIYLADMKVLINE